MPSGMHLRRRVLLILTTVLAGCGSVSVGDETDAAPGAAADAAVDAGAEVDAEIDARAVDPGVVLLYDLEAPLIQDGDDLFVPDASGNDHRGAVTPGTIPGSVMVVSRADGSGNALMFPPPGCTVDCPRVNLVAEGSADLDPGGADFAVSLDLLVPEGSPGDENVAQKGFFDSDGGQWKIEVDAMLRPLCVFRYGPGVDDLINARVLRPIADGEWHTLRCERRGDLVEARLDAGDGEDTRSVPIPDGVTLAIDNPDSILVGGQAQGQTSDQFYGILDNVKVEIAAPR